MGCDFFAALFLIKKMLLTLMVCSNQQVFMSFGEISGIKHQIQIIAKYDRETM